MSVVLSRRHFLSAGMAWSLGTGTPSAVANAPLFPADLSEWPALLGAWRDGTKNYAGIWLPGNIARGVELTFRAHEVVLHPLHPERAVAMARRPGKHIALLDIAAGSLLIQSTIDAYRSLNGHCTFSADGKLLYTTENDLVAGNGIIGVRHADSLIKCGELPSYGVGPHGILLEESGESLLIANGGVLAIPKPAKHQGEFLVTRHMDPSLVRINVRDGRLLGQWRLPDPYLSIRHLARNRNAMVGVALQSAHIDATARLRAPVIALFDGKNRFEAIDGSLDAALNGYGGDIACAGNGTELLFAVGCTHADRIAWWDDSGRWRGSSPLRSACAVGSAGPTERGIVAATEYGDIAAVSSADYSTCLAKAAGIAWENHIASVELK